MSNEAKRLAWSIGRCDNFLGALNGEISPCAEVIHWQRDQHRESALHPNELKSFYHCPEPWAGNLTEAKIMFLSSNPSFDPNEKFPTLEWDEDTSVDFFVNRFSVDPGRLYGATDGPTADRLDRVILKDESLTGKVKTWYSLRNRAAALLDKEAESTLASRDYVMTEVVHCKSRNEHGVAKALPVCVGKWLKPKLTLTSARLIIVSGSHAGRAVKQAVGELTGGSQRLKREWGFWKEEPAGLGKWPKSWAQLSEWKRSGAWGRAEQESHIETLTFDLDGEPRQFTFLWMPHPVRSVPQNLLNTDLYSPEVIAKLRALLVH